MLFSFDLMVWKEPQLLRDKCSLEILDIFTIFRIVEYLSLFERIHEKLWKIKLDVNPKLIEEKRYNFQENHSLWRSIIARDEGACAIYKRVDQFHHCFFAGHA